ncbi:tail protein [Bacillus phage Karezi]|uniref:Tail knob protein n=1 Tax=Bacillus phage Karezi TaxID=2591398 RepID=A0A514AAN7_9CAUD|nr:tail protein [Bacillus phage Karezi]QDH50338.1 tail knob protein [Bacillus phage Karezi]
MATLPTSGGLVRIFSGIPFTSDYKHTRWFSSQTQQLAYFDTQNVVHTMSEVKFIGSNANRGANPYTTVNAPYDKIYNANYMMFENTKYENRWFYAFITHMEWVSASSTRVYFKIDTLQSWMHQMQFKPSYVIREHTREYNADGTPVINTIDEGLDYGTEYETVAGKHYQPFKGLQWLVIQASREIHDAEEGDQEIAPAFIGAPQPLVTYVMPIDRITSSRFPDVTVSFPVSNVDRTSVQFNQPVEDLLEELYKNENSVNSVVNIYMTENTGMPITSVNLTENAFTVNIGAGMTATHEMIGDFDIMRITSLPQFFYVQEPDGEYDIYAELEKPPESKLLMYPYTVVVLDDFRGGRQQLQVEYLPNGKITLLARGSLGNGNKTTYSARGYNGNSDYNTMENSIVNENTNDITIINDYTSAYMQGNANSLRNKIDTTAFNGILNTIGSTTNAVGAGASRNPLALAQGATDLVQTAGNSVLNIQAIDAKLKDIQNIPPQLSKMGGNTFFSYGNNYTGISMIIKQIKPEYKRKLQDFFKCYGYKVNRVKVPNLDTRTAFNYIQTESANITGRVPNEDLNELRAIFDGGVTLWHINNVGDYTVANGVK